MVVAITSPSRRYFDCKDAETVCSTNADAQKIHSRFGLTLIHVHENSIEHPAVINRSGSLLTMEDEDEDGVRMGRGPLIWSRWLPCSVQAVLSGAYSSSGSSHFYISIFFMPALNAGQYQPPTITYLAVERRYAITTAKHRPSTRLLPTAKRDSLLSYHNTVLQ